MSEPEETGIISRIVPQRQTFRAMTMLAAMVVVVAGMKAASSVIIPILIAGFFGILAWPLIAWLNRSRIPNWIAFPVILLIALGAFTAMGVVVGTSVNSFIGELDEYQAQIEERFGDTIEQLNRLGEEYGFEVPQQDIEEALQPQRLLSLAGSLVSSLSALLSNSFVALLVLIFLLVETTVLPQKVRLAFPDAHQELQRLKTMVTSVQRYVMIKTAASMITGGLAGLACFALGVPYPALWGLIAFLLNYVPTVGSIIAAIPACLLAFLLVDLKATLLLAGAYFAINTLIGNIIEPRWLGRTLGLSPLFIVLSLLLWGFVFGPIGMFLAVPLTMIVKILLENSDDMAWLSLVLGSGAEVREEIQEGGPEGTGRYRVQTGAVSLRRRTRPGGAAVSTATGEVKAPPAATAPPPESSADAKG